MPKDTNAINADEAEPSTPAQVLVKKGLVVLAVTLPEKPPLHMQPVGTLLPAEFAGHATAEQVGLAPAENEV